ncbi:MAG: phosphoglucosamine mutase [Clostridia bacterium]|nr:phosphoglucosamine mutase [Clostridia bacterium]
MGKLFGTDGVRGRANEKLTVELAYKLGMAGAYVLTTIDHKPTILVGRDTRRSGDMLESALVAGMCAVGANVAVAGVIPTPAIAYLVREYKMDAGVMISASHNPFEDNGIKFFNSKGYKLSDEIEAKIEELILNDRPLPLMHGADVGYKVRVDDAGERYISFLQSKANKPFDGIKIALDCANGASSFIAPKVFGGLGADVISIFDKPDGININAGCGSTHVEEISRLCRENTCIGFAFDGDADRLIAIGEDGRVVDGDCVMGICARFMKANGLLKKDTVVSTIMSNLGLEEFLKDNGIDMPRTGVGDRYVLERMLEEGYNFGGENSGHIIFLDHNTTGDGMLTAIMLLNVVLDSGRKLCELKDDIRKYPQILLNVRIASGRRDFENEKDVLDAIKQAESELGENGRVNVRASGTEPVLRIMIEAKDEEKTIRLSNMIKDAMIRSLN